MGQQILGRKQKISNDAWLKAMEQIEDLVSKQELDEKVRQTVKDIKATTGGKKAAVAWSGGKDSLVLADVCRQAGIEDSVLVVSNLEYKAFTDWVDANKPPKLEIINTGQDLEWLTKHPQMLFPQDSGTAAQWFHIVQHRGQAKYYKEHDLNMLLLGRRRADGNYVGKGSNIYTDGKGVTRFSPLADWSHEEVLAYIHYYHWPCLRSMIGRTAIYVEHIPGRHVSGPVLSKTDGKRSTTLTVPLWKKLQRRSRAQERFWRA